MIEDRRDDWDPLDYTDDPYEGWTEDEISLYATDCDEPADYEPDFNAETGRERQLQEYREKYQ